MEPYYYTPPAPPDAIKFDLPEFKLPAYDQLLKGADKVFDKTDAGRVPRKPSFEELLKMDADKFAQQPNLLNPIAEYSKADSEGFTNPSIAYDPTIDMSDAYGRYDPATWGKSFDKMWDTTANNLMSGTKNLWHGLTAGVSEGRVSAIWDNEYSRELAEITDNLEKSKVLHFAKEDQGTTSAWLKQLLPSMGYVVSGIAEIAAQTVVLTAAGTVVGAVTGEGVGAIPGALVGFGTAMAKNVSTIKNAITGIGKASNALWTLSTANKIKSGAQLIGRGLLSANGEAALNSQMASRRILEEKKAAYFQQNGRYMTGDDLAQAEQDAHNTGSVTMALNLPLIAASEIYQFGNLMRGKSAPSIMEKLAFKIDKATGEAIPRFKPLVIGGKTILSNATQFVGTQFLKESGAEGFEEFAQGVIEDATVEYFNGKADNRRNYLSIFVDSAYKRAMSGEGASDFLGGALIGGISNAADLRSINTVKRNSEKFINSYNTSTGVYFDGLANAVKSDTALKEAIKTGDVEGVRNISQKALIDMVNAHAKAGSTQAFADTLDAMDQMDNQEFIKAFGVNVSPEEQATIMAAVTQEYKAAVKVRDDVDMAYQVNPFESENWFQRQLMKLNSDYDVDKGAASDVWETYKDILTSNTIRYDHTAGRQAVLYDLGAQNIPGFASIIGSDIPSVVSTFERSLEDRINANLPNVQGFSVLDRIDTSTGVKGKTSSPSQDKALLDKLKSTESVEEKYQLILDYTDSIAPGSKDAIKEYNTEAGAATVLLNETNRLQSKSGQRKAIKKILDYQRWYNGVISDPLKQSPSAIATNPAAPANPVGPATDVETTVAPAEEVVAPETTAPEAVIPPVVPPPTATRPVVEQTIDPDEEFPELTITENADGKEDLSGIYGEGLTEDSPARPPAVTERQEATKKVVPEVVDPELDQDIQVDEAELSQNIKDLQPGEFIPLPETGVEITTPNGENITKIENDKGSIVATTDEGKQIPLRPEPLTGLNVSASDDTVTRYAQENNLTPENRAILDQLLIKSATLEC